MRFTPCAAAMAAVLALSAPAFAAGTESPDAQALAAAMAAYGRAMREGRVAKPGLLTLIDYTRPSTERRLWVVDVLTGRVQLHELVAHGRNSGEVLPTAFSNADGTHMSSLGLFVTRDSYVGSNGYSLRLDGLDPGLNDHALARAIVIHGAPYVSESIAALQGRLGRSWGCPAVSSSVARPLIDLIKGGSVVFVYGKPDSAS